MSEYDELYKLYHELLDVISDNRHKPETQVALIARKLEDRLKKLHKGT